MTFSLNEDEQNGVSIAVNTILKVAYRVGETEDWSETASKWWNQPRDDEGTTAMAMLVDKPEQVVRLAIDTYFEQRAMPGIYVLPTQEGVPPRAAFVVEVAPGMQAAIGGAEYTEGAWRFPDGTEVPDELSDAITSHAESPGVEWGH